MTSSNSPDDSDPGDASTDDSRSAGDHPPQSPEQLFRTAVSLESGRGVLALLLGWAVGPDARDGIPEADAANVREIALGIGYGLLAAVPLYAAITAMRKIPWQPIRDLEKLGDEGMFAALMSLTVPEMLTVSLCAGVGEELLFRGWLLPAIASWMPERIEPQVAMGLALAGSSVLFGLVHPITKLYIVVAALIGVYFGALYLWSGNLLVPIVAHAAYDAVLMVVSKFQDANEWASEEAETGD